MFLSAINLLAVGVLAYGFLNEPVRTFLLEETPYAVAIIGLVFLALCVNAIMLGRSAFIRVDLGRFTGYCLAAVNFVGTCLCVFAAYAAFKIGAVWSGSVAVALAVIFLADVLFLRERPV